MVPRNWTSVAFWCGKVEVYCCLSKSIHKNDVNLLSLPPPKGEVKGWWFLVAWSILRALLDLLDPQQLGRRWMQSPGKKWYHQARCFFLNKNGWFLPKLRIFGGDFFLCQLFVCLKRIFRLGGSSNAIDLNIFAKTEYFSHDLPY